MSHALPSPTRSLAIPLATLVLGAGAGVAATAILNDDEIVFRSSPPAAVIDEPKSTAAPVPERITNAPAASSASSNAPAPVPERVGPQPSTSSLSGVAGESPAPVPERISGTRTR